MHSVHATEFGRRSGRLDGELPRAVHVAERAAVQAFSTQRRPDVVLVCSEAMRTEVVGVLGADPSRVHVVPAAVDATAWVAPPEDADRARSLWVPPDGPLLVAAGRLEWEKGFSTVLRALPAVARRHPGVRLVVAGDGSYRPTLEALAVEVGAADRITWTGLARARAAARAAGGGRRGAGHQPLRAVRPGGAAGPGRTVRPSSSPRSAASPRRSNQASPACGSPPATSTTWPPRCRRCWRTHGVPPTFGEAGRAAVRAWTPAAMAEATTALYPR